MDSDGYPLPETLKRIQEWEIKEPKDCLGLIAYVEQLWIYPSYFTAHARRVRPWKHGRLQRRYEISTGGWSGHEDIIEAMQSNWIFWALAWYSHRTGGHYEFRV